jgi:hypothetical protein
MADRAERRAALNDAGAAIGDATAVSAGLAAGARDVAASTMLVIGPEIDAGASAPCLIGPAVAMGVPPRRGVAESAKNPSPGCAHQQERSAAGPRSGEERISASKE